MSDYFNFGRAPNAIPNPLKVHVMQAVVSPKLRSSYKLVLVKWFRTKEEIPSSGVLKDALVAADAARPFFHYYGI